MQQRSFCASSVHSLGALVTTDTVGRSMEEDGSFYSTYGWHPRSTAAAIASLRWMTKNRRQLLANVERLSGYFHKRLRAMDFSKTAELTIRDWRSASMSARNGGPRISRKTLARQAC